MSERIERLEERVADLLRSVDDLSDEVARQARVIAVQERRLRMLLEREATREADAAGAEVVADRPPPHW
jgi:SlyX protein